MWPTDYGDDYPSGDPRRCPAHPDIVISSPDGLFDGVCPRCESEADADPEVAEWEAARAAAPDTRECGCGSGLPPTACHERDFGDPPVLRRMGRAIPASAFDDDIPF